MSKLIRINEEYAGWIKDLSLRFRQSQIKAAVKVNGELLKFYWELGRDIVEKQVESKWGEGFFKNLSMDLQEALPRVKGLSIQNLYYTKKFYLLYCQSNKYFPQLVEELQKAGDSSIFPQAVGKLKEMGKSSSPSLFSEILEELLQIPWGHHRYIIDKCNDNPSKAHCQALRTLNENYPKTYKI
ncbi:MAG TPA: DUF1016 N-terminal domain-containing protein [Bacteroidales bacterium]|mgnify:CR=1 FL=1|nr:DUF1016 N-terminal domain-containing protein [Bacteroidales bacterium]HQB21665.1 DUF1016 N-terminal domain-containing protein [Bacteroidales bacterium]